MQTRFVFLLVGSFYLFSLWHSERARATLNGSDAWGYYAHLPALFLYHDTGDYSRTIAAWQQHYPNRADPRQDAYGVRITPAGKRAIKYPVGVAILETPFFAAAHLFCRLSDKYPADGFSLPYAWAISLSSLVFALLGLFFLYKNLQYSFDEKTSLLTVLVVALATNLYFFVAYTQGMSHPAVFCLVALLLLLTRRIYQQFTISNAISLGACLGMIALVRTQDLVIAMVPLLWGVRDIAGLQARILYLWSKKSLVFWSVGAFFTTLVPQIIYWQHVSGQLWYNGYQGETFDWLHAQIGRGLFSFRNGWLVYTPVMGLSLWGIWHLRNKAPEWLWPLLVFLPIHIYVSYAWWCWMYINGFGSRPMIDGYALLAIPLAAWIQQYRNSYLATGLLIMFMIVNVLQTFQTRYGHYWSERGSWAFYREMLLRPGGGPQAIAAFESREPQPVFSPRYDKILARKEAAGNPDSNLVQIGGRQAWRCRDEFCHSITLQNDTAHLKPGDWLKLSVEAWFSDSAATPGLDQLARLVADFSPSEGKPLKYRSVNIATQIGNPNFILWKSNGKGVWGTCSFFVKVPASFDNTCRLTAYLWNPGRQDFFVSSLRIEKFK